MTERLHVAPRGCSTCPYRRDVPPGIWEREEYEKLRMFDRDVSRMEDPTPALAIFLCHQTPMTGVETLCRGWLSTHRDSVAVRLGVTMNKIDPDLIPDEEESLYYSSGTEACEAGIAHVDDPPPEAVRASSKLLDLRRRSEQPTGEKTL